MHDTAYQIGGLVIDAYLPATPARILEIGAQNVNGTLRDLAPRNAEYVGLDFEAGAGVDIVVTSAADWNVPDDYFDLVIASSVFEHDKAFWRTFLAMCAKAKPGGHLYISAPSNGTVHRYPQDYWRFYPDSGLALEDWARGEGFDVLLVESFVAERQAEVWNDFCAVFRRGPTEAELNRDFVQNKVACTNALTWRSSVIVNPIDDSEDTRLLRSARDEIERWMRHSAHIENLNNQKLAEQAVRLADFERLADEQASLLGSEKDKIARLEEELIKVRGEAEQALAKLDGFQARVDEQAREIEDQARLARDGEVAARVKDEQLAKLRVRAEQLTAELARAHDELQAQSRDQDSRIRALVAAEGQLRSRLAQREEEAAQAWAAATERATERDDISAELERTKAALTDARGWVETLALTRTKMERRIQVLERETSRLASDLSQARSANQALTDRTRRADQVLVNQGRLLAEQAEDLSDARSAIVELSDRNETPVNERKPPGEALARAIDDREQSLRSLKSSLDHFKVELTRTREELSAACRESTVWSGRAERAELELEESRGRLREAREEIAKLSEIIASAQDDISKLRQQGDWMRRTAGFLLEPGKWWWRFMPATWQTRNRDRRMQLQDLFDADLYVGRYPDVAASGQDPLRHFIRHGIVENRSITNFGVRS